MANVTAIKKIRVAQAELTNPFALDATGRPDKAYVNTNAAFIQALRGDLSITANTLMVENDVVSGDFGMARPIPEAGYDAANSAYYELRRGQLNVTLQVRTLGEPGVGASFPTYDDLGMIMMLKSAGFRAETIADAADWGDELDASGDSNNNLATYNNADSWVGGDLFMATVGDRAVVHNVNYVDSTNSQIAFSPSWYGVNAGADIANDQDVRTMYTLAPTLENTPAVHFRLDFDKAAAYCFGCRPSTITFQRVGERTIQVTFTMECGQIEWDYSAADILDGSNVEGRTPRACGRVASELDARVVYSERIPSGCGGDSLEDYLVDVAGELCIQDWTMTITPTVEFVRCSSNIIGLSDVIITNRDYQIETTVEYHNGSNNNQANNPLDSDFLEEALRSYSFAFGPHTQGNGMGVFLGAGFLKQSASGRNMDGTYLTQTLMLGGEEFYGDNIDAGGDLVDGGTAAQAKIKIGFGR